MAQRDREREREREILIKMKKIYIMSDFNLKN